MSTILAAQNLYPGNGTVNSVEEWLYITNFGGVTGNILNWLKVSTMQGASRSTVGINSDGNLYVWGSNDFGELGLGYKNNTKVLYPVRIGSDKIWKDISCGELFFLSLSSDGIIYAGGRNDKGQLGDNTLNDNTSRKPIASSSFIFGTTGSSPLGIAIDSNNNIYTANADSNNVTKITPNGVSSTFGTTGTGPQNIVIDSNNNIYTANAGSSTVTKITQQGDVSTFGTTGSGALGIAIDSNNNIYTANANSNTVTKITQQGDVSTFGTTGASPRAIAIDSNNNIYTVTANASSNTVTKITQQGDVSTFGTTGSFALGIAIDSNNNIYTANFVSNNVTKITSESPSFISISAGRNFALAINADGDLWSWGNNDGSQLGNGGGANRYYRARTGIDTDWTAIAAGFRSSLALKSDGSLYSWGSGNTLGRTIQRTDYPTIISYPTNPSLTFTKISINNQSGESHAMALGSDGNIYTWGNMGSWLANVNNDGSTPQYVPAMIYNNTLNQYTEIVQSNTWVHIYAGYHYSLAINSIGELWGWGIIPGESEETDIPIIIGDNKTWVYATNRVGLVQAIPAPSPTPSPNPPSPTPSVTPSPNPPTPTPTSSPMPPTPTPSPFTSANCFSFWTGATYQDPIFYQAYGNLVQDQSYYRAGAVSSSSIFGTTGTNPRGIAIDSNNNIYTANYTSFNVIKITQQGDVSTLGNTGPGPYAIAIDSNNNIYTANANSITVTKITQQGDVSTFRTTGTTPYGIAIDSNNNIYTANYGSNNVTKITQQGDNSTFGTTGSGPVSIAIDSNNNIYTANSTSNTVTKITQQGVSSVFGTTGSGPYAIAIDSNNNIYTANIDSNTVTKITQQGDVSTFGTTGSRPTSIAIDSFGNIYTANYNSNTVTKITQQGDISTFGTTGSGPTSIAIDSNNNIYTANFGSNNVTKITFGGDEYNTRINITNKVLQFGKDALNGKYYILEGSNNGLWTPAIGKIYVRNTGSNLDGEYRLTRNIGNRYELTCPNCFNSEFWRLASFTYNNTQLNLMTISFYDGSNNILQTIGGNPNQDIISIVSPQSSSFISDEPNTARIYIATKYNNTIANQVAGGYLSITYPGHGTTYYNFNKATNSNVLVLTCASSISPPAPSPTPTPSASPLCVNNLINGNFENNLTGWVYEDIGLEQLGTTIGLNNNHWVDLNSCQLGYIEQTINTNIGYSYTIYYCLSGNNFTRDDNTYSMKEGRISVRPEGGSITASEDFSFDITTAIYNVSNPKDIDMNWTNKSFIFTATSDRTTLRFQGLAPANNCFGAAIDNVSVIESNCYHQRDCNSPSPTPTPTPTSTPIFMSADPISFRISNLIPGNNYHTKLVLFYNNTKAGSSASLDQSDFYFRGNRMRGTQTDITTNLITILRKTSNIDQLIVQATTTDLDNGSIIKTDSMFASCQNSIACDSPTVPGGGPTIPVVGPTIPGVGPTVPGAEPNSSICPEMPVPQILSSSSWSGRPYLRWIVRPDGIILAPTSIDFEIEYRFFRPYLVPEDIQEWQQYAVPDWEPISIQDASGGLLGSARVEVIAPFLYIISIRIRTISTTCNPVKKSAWTAPIDFYDVHA